MTADEWCPLDDAEPPVCDECGKRHIPNGTAVGQVGGMPVIIDCRVPDDAWPGVIV